MWCSLQMYKQIYEYIYIHGHPDGITDSGENYYDENKDDLELKENIFKWRYVKTTFFAPKLDLLRNIFRSSDEEDVEDLMEYCRQFATDYHLEESKWVYFSKFANKLPVKVNNQRKIQ